MSLLTIMFYHIHPVLEDNLHLELLQALFLQEEINSYIVFGLVNPLPGKIPEPGLWGGSSESEKALYSDILL